MLEVARAVYTKFLECVVARGVFSDAQRTLGTGRPLGNSVLDDVESGARLDGRTPLLGILSGKGGWVPGRAFASRETFVNVTLLDHLASVVRGALVLAEIDLRASGVRIAELPARLARIAAVAFLHDADKMLERDRIDALRPDDVARLMREYCVSDFLAAFGQAPDPSRMTALIDQVEITRANRMRAGVALPSLQEIQDCTYVTLADRLDGAFLDTRRGIVGVVEELASFAHLRTDALRSWRAVCITSPHTPFVLDEFQRAFSHACEDRHEFPPLLEVHHDGRLLLVVPESHFDAVFDAALDELARIFVPRLRVYVSTRGGLDVLGGGSGVEDLLAHLDSHRDTASRALRVSVDLVRAPSSLKDRIDELFASLGLAPRWPDLAGYAHRLLAPWPLVSEGDDIRLSFIVDAAAVAVALSCKSAPASLELRIPGAPLRERELVALLAEHGMPAPDWLLGVEHELSRRALLAAYSAALPDSALREPLLGCGGLVDLWLCGDGARRGLLDKIDRSGERLAAAVQARLRAALSRRLARSPNEAAEGRCHFTNEPVARSARIDKSAGLYGVKVSAFSGREGRPELLNRAKSETLVSDLAHAEHRLRSLRVRSPRATPDLPVLVSSPTTAGLFASLSYARDDLPGEYSLHDALRVRVRPGRVVFSDVENFSCRYRIGRYDTLPARTASRRNEPGLLAFLCIVFETALRIGRPIHVFRGLPTPQRAFVSFDSLPAPIVAALGDSSFRLEQIPSRIILLRLLDELAKVSGLGLEIAMRVADPATRFSGACDALLRLVRMSDSDSGPNGHLRHSLLTLLEDPETMNMRTESDDAIVRFATAMARVQRAPLRSDGENVPELGFRIALEAVEGASQLGQSARVSLVAAVAGSLMRELDRKSLFSSALTRAETTLALAIDAAAAIFVDALWLSEDVFRARALSSRQRRTALAIYRMSFERAARAHHAPAEAPSVSPA